MNCSDDHVFLWVSWRTEFQYPLTRVMWLNLDKILYCKVRFLKKQRQSEKDTT